MYVDNFLLKSNTITAFSSLKKSLLREYDIKDIRDAKTIISWQVIRDLDTKILRICQLAYIRDLFEEKNLTNYNAPTILIKARLAIEMNKPDDYNEANFTTY